LTFIVYFSQRSTALVSLLPLPEESADYLFKTAGLENLAKGTANTDDPIGLSPYDFYGMEK